jgi:two-component system CheB/CheR fusion protein
LTDLTSLTSQVYQQSSVAMLIMDVDFKIESVNPAFIRSTGFEPVEVRGAPLLSICDELVHTRSIQDIQNRLAETNCFSSELAMLRKNGSLFSAQIIIDGLQKPNGCTQYYLVLILDISEQKQRESELRYYSEIDPLTNLGNRKFLFQSLDNAIASAKRFNYTVALMFLDLDGFKQVNDFFGHGEGDKILLEAAQRLKRCVRQVDTVARLGGDEFVVILNGTSTDMIAGTAKRIIDFLTLTIKDQVNEIQVSASIGISLYPRDSKNPLVLLKYADEAMYKAKAKGKRQFCWHLESK